MKPASPTSPRSAPQSVSAPTSSTAAIPRPGLLVTVRNRRGVIGAVQPFQHRNAGGVFHLVRVDYSDLDGPAEDQLVWELEPHARLVQPRQIPSPDPGAQPMIAREFDALTRAVRWSALQPFLSPDLQDEKPWPSPLASPFHGAIQPDDYQFVPLVKALRMPRISLLISDDVGLGKTIEAGLILAELILRRRVRRVLIICPASLRFQWQQEMAEKFALNFDLVDRQSTITLRQQLGPDANPWRSFSKVVASYHYLKQADVWEEFRAASQPQPGAPNLSWDLLIVDEAHNLSPSPVGKESDLSRALGLIAPFFEHKVFLSATPHNGHTRSFTGLLERLDPVRFSRKGELVERDKTRIREVNVRRLKREINAATNPPRFCERQLSALSISLDSREARLSLAFQEFRDAVKRAVANEARQRQRVGAFAVEILGKRLLSCPWTFAESWNRYKLALVEDSAVSDASARAAELAVREDTGDDLEAESRHQHAVHTVGLWLKPFLSVLKVETAAIDAALSGLNLCPFDAHTNPGADARFDSLVHWIDKNLRSGKGWRADERLIIFTEYKTTLDYLCRRLVAQYRDENAILTLSGNMGDAERANIKAAFNDPSAKVRLLIATDAASEGLNLQETARYLLHWDVPWNPARLLVFTDNRQDAAFQAGWMQDHARRFRLRALMWEKIKSGPVALGDLVFHLDQLLDGDESLSRALLPEVWRWVPKTAAGNEHQDKRRFYLRCQVLREFTTSPRQRIGLESWGRVRVDYYGLSNDDAFYQKWGSVLGLTKEKVADGIAALLDYERRGAQLVWDASGRIFSRFFGDGAWEIQRGFLPDMPGGPKGLVLQRTGSHDVSRIRQWASSRDTVAIQAASRWGVKSVDRLKFLEELWEFLRRTRVMIPVDLKGQKGKNLPQSAGAHQIDGDRLLLVPSQGQVWRCQTCRRIHLHRTPNDACMRFRCQGQLVPFSEDPDSYDLRVLDGAFTMLRPREHSAQVPQADRTEAELMFKGKSERLNCLVCTPTLELGVDIGQLDSVLMRNIPPLASNYFQRAGRAGRRHRMAVNLAYARPASHDRAYFSEPLKLLNGVVTAPRFNLHNGLLVRKHVHASLLTALFRLLRNRDGALAGPAVEELQTALSIAVPSQIRDWFFAADGSVLSRPVTLGKFAAELQRHRSFLIGETRAVFASFWPAADAELITDDRLGRYLDEAPLELESVVARLWARLQWHRRQLDELGRIRARDGSLDDEEQAFERRCNEFINRLKGESSRQRRQAEGFDETNTYAVLAAEGFLPGYGLDRGSVKATALANRAHGGTDFELPRPSSLAVREYVPGNLIYANGERYVPRTFHLLAEQTERFVVDIAHEAVAPEAGGGAMGSASIPAVPICDVDAPHISRISDEEDFRFQMPVCVWGYELGRHDGGLAFRAGDTALQLRRATYVRLVNVGPRDLVAQADLGYPACLVSGQTRSPYASAAELQNFKDTQMERHGRPIEEHLAFFTDIVADTLKFPDLTNRIEAYSLGEALRIAAASVLDMEVDDLQLLVIGHPGDDKVDLVIYDPMPGGSGLLQQLLSNWPDVVTKAKEICEKCEGQCDHSCIDCLQTFRNAFYHPHLDRHVALEMLQKSSGSLAEENAIPPNQPTPASQGPNELPVNEAEDLLLHYMLAAGLPRPESQKEIQRPRPYVSTTPDFYYPDDQSTGICIYLDGLSAHIHGNPATKQRDTEIRSQLETEGYEVFPITYTKLFDQDALRMFLVKVAKSLVGRDAAARISRETGWFQDARAVALREKATARLTAPA